jgi:hypothetical protein
MADDTAGDAASGHEEMAPGDEIAPSISKATVPVPMVDEYTLAFIAVLVGFKGRTALKDAVSETAAAFCSAATAFTELAQAATIVQHEVGEPCFFKFVFFISAVTYG